MDSRRKNGLSLEGIKGSKSVAELCYELKYMEAVKALDNIHITKNVTIGVKQSVAYYENP
ncbi:hypothetical protein TAGGR_2281 [Thermodesulfovibrio aggregans]|uniref:Uncharacterized protein n=1 Tax=Thermodesulfovibrio aggregans TaxID=86166 RepID=A0A0U9HXL5_9BACT|nr:hypothetical protein [Thermodesulfovibrio aggregans]GAQ95391.1 hypothetical protein TAGGR_2281 [Thermodesulfovibrio aggregans]